MLRPGGATGRWSDKNVGHRTSPRASPLIRSTPAFQAASSLGAAVRYEAAVFPGCSRKAAPQHGKNRCGTLTGIGGGPLCLAHVRRRNDSLPVVHYKLFRSEYSALCPLPGKPAHGTVFALVDSARLRCRGGNLLWTLILVSLR